MTSSIMGKDDDGTASIASSSKPWGGQNVLSKPLYVYQVPKELLQSLQLRSIDVRESDQVTAAPSHSADGDTQIAHENGNGRTSASGSCSVCPKSSQWDGIRQVRAHVRSDWHRYNTALVKKGRSGDCLSEDSFNALVDELSDEYSSESDADERERAPVDHITALLRKSNVSSTAKDESDGEEEEGSTRLGITAKEPYLWFVTTPSSRLHIQQTQFGVLRAQFPDSEGSVVPKDWHIDALRKMQIGTLQPGQVPRVLKRFKGSSAANEAESILAAVFVDASGERSEDDEVNGSDSSSEDDDLVDEAATVSSASIATSPSMPAPPLRTWTILLMAGGNFSATIIALNPREQLVSKKKGVSERQYLILARKQIHKYTTRRKQGGAQSAQDASGKFAKSAGAQLRRYGEQALGEEIRALLSTKAWRDGILQSDKVWVRAGLKSARGILWNWAGTEASPLDTMRREDKVQSLPIATRKPNVGECLRCFAELTKVRVRHDTEEEMQARDRMYRAQLENSARARQERRTQEKEKLRREAEAKEAAQAAKKKAASNILDEKEVLRRERLVRLIDMIRKGRLENTINHLEKYERDLLKPAGWDSQGKGQEPDDVDDAVDEGRQRVNVTLPFWWRYEDAREKGTLLSKEDQLTGVKAQLIPSTLLQVAAEGGHANVVSYFLIERHSDPAIGVLPAPLVDAESDDVDIVQRFPHRSAYDLCSTRDARDVFRRLMAAQPEWCKSWSGMDVGGARVSKALTSEMEEAREKEEKIRDKRLAMKEKARLRQEQEETKRAHEIDLASIKKAAAVPPPPSSAVKNRLGGAGSSAPRVLQERRDEALGLSAEAKARIEREKRARAAEARFKAMQGGS